MNNDRSKRERTRTLRDKGFTVTLMLFDDLETVIDACAKAERWKKRNLISFLLEQAADDFKDDESAHEHEFGEALAWCDKEHPNTRKARYLSSEALSHLEFIERRLKCSRDQAFNAGCLVGLIGELEDIKEDCQHIESALTNLHKIADSNAFQKLGNLVPLIFFPEASNELTESMNTLSTKLRARIGPKIDALNEAKSLSRKLPKFLQRVLKGPIKQSWW